MEDREHVVYILKCADNTLYTGYTNDLRHRFCMHEKGKGAKYTRGRGPFTLVYTEYFATKEAAMRKEYAIKRLRRHEKEQLICAKRGKDYVLNIQKSFEKQSGGTLYVIPTPIGNLEDITYRALTVLRSVALIAAEDTRNTKKLLRHFDILTPLISYHEHNMDMRENMLLDRLGKGDSIAIVSDAGMPGISDPGHEMIEAAIASNRPVVVLPGANAAVCALVGSGISSNEFLFYGFLPRKKKDQIDELKRLKPLKATLLFYESPYRLRETVTQIYEQLGNRKMAIARELTKRYEEYVRGTASDVVSWANENELKGEFCIVTEGSREKSCDANQLWWSPLSVNEHIAHYMENEKMKSKEAIKKVAEDRHMAKRDVYQIYHID